MSRKEIVGPLFFEDTITAENYPALVTKFIALLEENKLDCWFEQDRVTVHNTKTTTALTYSVIALSGIDFGHRDHQTLHHLHSFCAHLLKKEPTAITQRTWRTLSCT